MNSPRHQTARGLAASLAEKVSSLGQALLDTVEAVYKQARYQVDYRLVQARLKYYSNSKNPRVIHTKLDNQCLVSLRTNPFNPYKVKPGDFLTCRSSSSDSWLDYYVECAGSEPLLEKKRMKRVLRRKTDLIEISFDDKVLRPHLAYSADRRSPSSGPGKPALSETSPCARPLVRPKTTPRLTIPHALGSLPLTPRKLACSPLSPFSKRESVSAPTMRTPPYYAAASPDSPWIHRWKAVRPNTQVRQGPEVWKTVLSEISLSAARISTALNEATNGVGRKDYFEENLNQARVQFHGPPTKVALTPPTGE